MRLFAPNILYQLNRGHYHLALCKMQTKPDRIKDRNIEIRTLIKFVKV